MKSKLVSALTKGGRRKAPLSVSAQWVPSDAQLAEIHRLAIVELSRRPEGSVWRPLVVDILDAVSGEIVRRSAARVRTRPR